MKVSVISYKLGMGSTALTEATNVMTMIAPPARLYSDLAETEQNHAMTTIASDKTARVKTIIFAGRKHLHFPFGHHCTTDSHRSR